MLFSSRIGRVSAGAALAVVMVGASGSAILFVTHPAAAESPLSAVTTVTCSVTGANYCIAGKITSSGIGVLGSSNTGTGVRATSNSNYAAKTATGFVVREAQAGRSTISFDYRIVATALGQTGQRTAATNPATIPHIAIPADLVPKLPAAKVIPSTVKSPNFQQ